MAQKRERLILIGIRNDLVDKINFHFPNKQYPKPILRDILLDVLSSECAKYFKEKEAISSLVLPGGYWRDIPEKITK
ncbi:DNA cytosine methyltransferase [Mycoplasma sp. 888]|uniref:DNA cytosine methyltransferase n=1 Tax=Mycoplasma sp. 888 TaxID=3108483 RepID=UPI002D785DD5|nr:DNA cytosine methyltransferase [Mycoplasma sp. 888]WRQ25934.1 DNA cytosine methyltransferase [Mycoplasma sp. 888]